MDKQMDEFLKIEDLGKIPNEVFIKYLDMVDELPRRGLKLYSEFFEAIDDSDALEKMGNIIKLQTFITVRKIQCEERKDHIEDPNDLSSLLSELEVFSAFDNGILKAVYIGFITGIAFAIDHMNEEKEIK